MLSWDDYNEDVNPAVAKQATQSLSELEERQATERAQAAQLDAQLDAKRKQELEQSARQKQEAEAAAAATRERLRTETSFSAANTA